MSAPNKNRADDQQDQRALPIPRNTINSFRPVAWTSTHELFWHSAVVESTSTSLNPIEFNTGFSRGYHERVLVLNLNNCFDPIQAVWHCNGFGYAPPAWNKVPKGLAMYKPFYRYWKVVKQVYMIDIEHVGGWKGDMIMPVGFLAYRVNNDLAEAPWSKPTTDPKWDIGVPSPTTHMMMQQHPRVTNVNNGQIIGPAHSYGFGTNDATFIHTYPSRLSFAYVYTPDDNAEDPSSTAVTTHWTAVATTAAQTPPTQKQELHLFCYNHLNPYESPSVDKLKAVLSFTIRVSTTVQWRDTYPASSEMADLETIPVHTIPT